MEHFSGVHLFHFFLIFLRNFDSILRPFFAVQLNCNTRGSFSCISSNVFKRSNNTMVLFTLYQHQTNQLTQIYLLSLPTAPSLHKFNIHGFQYSRFQYSRFSILTVSSSISNVFKLFQTASTRSNLLAFYPRLFVTQVRYPRFSILTVPPVFPTSSNTQTTPPPPRKTSSAPDKSSNSHSSSPHGPFIAQVQYPRFLHLHPKISPILQSTPRHFLQTAPWIKTEIISLHPMEHTTLN